MKKLKNSYSGKKIQIAFFGDSICYGQGISIHKGWVPRISECLDAFAQEKGVEIVVINAGVNGNTTRLALERMPYDIQSHKIDTMIIQFGMNDCNYWKTDRGVPRVSKKAFEANLEEIINRALIFGCKKIFLNTNHPTARYDTMPSSIISYQESNAAYNKITRKVAHHRKEVRLIDIESHINKCIHNGKFILTDILLPDKLHLSITGHKVYFDLVYPKIKKAIEELLAV